MRARAESTKPAAVRADVLAVPFYRDDLEMPSDLAELDAAAGGAIGRALAWGEFNPIENETALVEAQGIGASWILLVASGRRGRGAWRARRNASKASRRLQGRGASSLAFWLRDGENADAYAAAAVGASQGTFRSHAYYGRVRDTPDMLRSVEEIVLVGESAPGDDLLRDAMAVADGVHLWSGIRTTGVPVAVKPCSARVAVRTDSRTAPPGRPATRWRWPMASNGRASCRIDPQTTSTPRRWPSWPVAWRPMAAPSRCSARARWRRSAWERSWAWGWGRPMSRA